MISIIITIIIIQGLVLFLVHCLDGLRERPRTADRSELLSGDSHWWLFLQWKRLHETRYPGEQLSVTFSTAIPGTALPIPLSDDCRAFSKPTGPVTVSSAIQRKRSLSSRNLRMDFG